MTECKYCKDPDGEPMYPIYGMAPHTHEYDSNGTIVLFSTRLLPRKEWPFNFLPDSMVEGFGIWYCPECKQGLNDD